MTSQSTDPPRGVARGIIFLVLAIGFFNAVYISGFRFWFVWDLTLAKVDSRLFLPWILAIIAIGFSVASWRSFRLRAKKT